MNTTEAEHRVRARLGRWPDDAQVAHLVLLDHAMVPTRDHVESWIDDARSVGAHTMRTGALFPASTPAFIAAGFDVIDTLSLLELDLDRNRQTDVGHRANVPSAGGRVRMRRMRDHDIADAEAVDRRAFEPPWANDSAALRDITNATPRHRARSVCVDGRMMAFSISGRASESGYVQRVAVDPAVRRRGLARLLVTDALDWMRRRRVETVLVNTATDNHGALALYRSLGFVERPDRLTILERSLADR